MNILLSANDKFIAYAKDLLLSISKNNTEMLKIYFLYIEISQVKIQELKSFVEKILNSKIYFFKIDKSILSGLPTTNTDGSVYFGPEAYLRLFAQYILPKSIDRVLYLDIDILCNNSLKELYNIDFKNKYYVACEDTGVSFEDKKRLGLKEEDKYINSGVLLINLKLLRIKQDIKELKNFIHQKKEILAYPDQDILNMLYKKKFLIVSNKYNYTPFRNQKQIKKIVLYHYVGKIKPWNTKEIYKIKLKFLLIYLKNEIYKKEYFKIICISIYYSFLRPLFLLNKIILKLLRKEI